MGLDEKLLGHQVEEGRESTAARVSMDAPRSSNIPATAPARTSADPDGGTSFPGPGTVSRIRYRQGPPGRFLFRPLA